MGLMKHYNLDKVIMIIILIMMLMVLLVNKRELAIQTIIKMIVQIDNLVAMGIKDNNYNRNNKENKILMIIIIIFLMDKKMNEIIIIVEKIKKILEKIN